MALRAMTVRRISVVGAVSIGLLVGAAVSFASPRQASVAGREAKNMVDCFTRTGVDLGVPADAVFFLAEVAVAPEPVRDFPAWSRPAWPGDLVGRSRERNLAIKALQERPS